MPTCWLTIVGRLLTDLGWITPGLRRQSPVIQVPSPRLPAERNRITVIRYHPTVTTVPIPLARLLLWRGVWVWVGMRAAIMLAHRLAPGAFGPSADQLQPVAALWLVGLCAAAVALEVLRRRERMLFANHGVGLPAIVAVGTVPAAFGEVAVRALLSA